VRRRCGCHPRTAAAAVAYPLGTGPQRLGRRQGRDGLAANLRFLRAFFFVCYSGATMAKRRLDALLVDRGLAPDLGKAQAMVMAGAVSVDECPTQKAGTLVDEDVALRLVERARYVGR